MFLRHEYLHVAEQLGLIFLGQSSEDRKVVGENVTPRFRCGLSAQSRSTAGFEEVEAHELKIRDGHRVVFGHFDGNSSFKRATFGSSASRFCLFISFTASSESSRQSRFLFSNSAATTVESLVFCAMSARIS